ncbi:hypothetical protein, partial [Faecalicatena contorta]|uniref:hypothetical protein n=1 Tax=Faecalicatena contorta TaxID=39482 RepID=UPI003216E6CB
YRQKRIGIFDAVVNQSAGKMPDTTPLKSGVSLGWGGWFDVYILPLLPLIINRVGSIISIFFQIFFILIAL